MGENLRRAIGVILGVGLFFAAAGCVSEPVTGRSQFILVGQEEELQLGEQAYKEELAKVKLSDNQELVAMVRRVGERIAAAADRPEYDWEFNVIVSEEQNAYCLPGGKVAIYTGILPVCRNEAGLATVMAHEIGHAVARHGAERMTQQIEVTLGAAVMSAAARKSAAENQAMIAVAYGAGTTVGYLLPFSRAQEYSADAIGLNYMARAGYDPNEALAFWRRFVEASKDAPRPPAFLSTHPAGDDRVKQLEELMSGAEAEYALAEPRYGAGNAIPSP